ncbi:hypothetical protein FF011L_33220 [Roseimaritima multifibrata]|uniref:Uncharacterized protein n=1 Tax=Roseimaritima multifibrata TaxID=1930274 RepID=A0A517MI30_9BACT|nr:hypothetical protein FF011L_33220 [Roseimaritima multifibrata]
MWQGRLQCTQGSGSIVLRELSAAWFDIDCVLKSSVGEEAGDWLSVPSREMFRNICQEDRLGQLNGQKRRGGSDQVGRQLPCVFKGMQVRESHREYLTGHIFVDKVVCLGRLCLLLCVYYLIACWPPPLPHVERIGCYFTCRMF